MKVFGVVGWKNAGKTTLVASLVSEIISRGLTVSTLKHTHHDVDLDSPGTDTHKHRVAGASEVMLASDSRIAIMRENQSSPPPSLLELLDRLSPVDIVIVEGFKRAPHPKIEVTRSVEASELIARQNESVIALASETELELGRDLSRFLPDDIKGIADFALSNAERFA